MNFLTRESNLSPRPQQGHMAPELRSTKPEDLQVDPARVAILSCAEGELSVNPEQRKLLCYISDGRLFIAEQNLMHHQVQSYLATLNRRQKKYRVVNAPMQFVHKLYTTLGGQAAVADSTKMMDIGMELIKDAAKRRASDIHIRVGAVTQIWYRIHGDLRQIIDHEKAYGERLIRTYYQALADISEETFKANERLDARISTPEKLPENIYGVRISYTPTDTGNLMVLRLLYNDANDTDLHALGFSDLQCELLSLLNEQPIGMNIIAGPTGSGKSTTLKCVLTAQIEISQGQRHVITVEDPPEYPIPGTVQTPVAGGTNEGQRSANFSEAITSAMRLDPDTIMIGEMRDKSSAQTALRASMTGHQVWTTLHANSAMAIIDRLVDLGLSIDLLTDHTLVTGLISQRLVKLLCPHCKQNIMKFPEVENRLSSGLKERIKRTLGAELIKVCLPSLEGCEHCNNTGFAGRTVVSEIIIPDPQFMAHLRAGDKIAARNHWINQQRGRTILEHTISKIKRGEVDPINAERVVGRLNMDGLLEDSLMTMDEIVRGGIREE